MRLTRASFFTRTVAIFLGAFASTSGCNQIIGLEVGDLDTGTTSSTTATGDTTTSPTTTVGPTTGSNGGMGGSGGDGIGGQGGQGGETPPPIPTDELVFWFDATQGLTENGGAVSQWNDLSGNDYHATQPTGLWQPTIGSIAGVQALTFDGDNDQMDLPTISADYSNGISIFAVFANSDPGVLCPPIFQLSNGPEIDDIDIHTETTALFSEV
ncbi:MAG: hypothetical protein HOV80_12340, partial [Polyangiaceae bacterium]|nr:hypothetical protein [Polyangiaceae bacterium]